jgi:hypothetical protein
MVRRTELSDYEPFCIRWRSLVSSNDRRGFARRTLNAILSSQPNTAPDSRQTAKSVFIVPRVAYTLGARIWNVSGKLAFFMGAREAFGSVLRA